MGFADDDAFPERQTVDIERCARLLGINRSTAYDLARRDRLPVPVIRLGRRMVVSRRALRQLLDHHHESPDSAVEGTVKGEVADGA